MGDRKCLIVFLLFIFAGCGVNDRQKEEQKSILFHYVCSLDERKTTIGRATSIDVASDGSFLVSNGSDIIGYDSLGHQRFVWNKKGRGPNEYLVSQQVRAAESAVFVWDSGSTKLLAYDRNGNGLWTYEYNSAICGFYPTDSSIYFYPCGRKWEYVVQELDIESMSVIHSFGSSSMSHKAFQSMNSAVPLTIQDGTLYYMARDKLDLFQVESENERLVEHFSSKTFRCQDITEDLFAINPQSGIEFISRNSFVVSVSVGKSTKILTAEGTANPERIQQTGSVKLSNNALVYRLYEINGKTLSISSCERMFDPALICERDGFIYVLKEDIDNETYQLFRLE
jgi:hypothetical protein